MKQTTKIKILKWVEKLLKIEQPTNVVVKGYERKIHKVEATWSINGEAYSDEIVQKAANQIAQNLIRDNLIDIYAGVRPKIIHAQPSRYYFRARLYVAEPLILLKDELNIDM